MQGSRSARSAGPVVFWHRRIKISAWLEVRFAESRPRALAALTRQFRDVDLAEEAFADACVRALRAWSERGVPDNPLAWLLTTARNAGIDRLRKAGRALADGTEAESALYEDEMIERIDQDGLRDDVLRLLFICCHPSLNRKDQLALALKIVAGLSVTEIARAFLIKPRTMEQRLTRAKRTVAANPVPFETPDLLERGRRLNEVSLMIYILFNEGWSTSAAETQMRLPLCEEAIRLARLLLDLFPGMAEQMSLLALLLIQHSRREARMDAEGNLVPLDDQDRETWDWPMIEEAAVLMQKAARHIPPGPMQLQAAIAMEHGRARRRDETDWARIETLYAALAAQQPTPIVRLNHAAAVAETSGPGTALAMLEPLAGPLVSYRWYHAMRASLLADLDRPDEARAAYQAALDLDPTGPEAKVLRAKITECEENSARLSGNRM